MALLDEDNAYLRKFALAPEAVAARPRADLGMVIVIPCHDEPDLTASLAALSRCDAPRSSVEIIVVVNHSEADSADIRRNNIVTLEAAEAWRSQNATPRLQVHLLRSFDQPRKRAGVGMARKLGMDEAVRRFEQADIGGNGVIVCFDADCKCDRNYLVELEHHFQTNANTPGCAICFEHPLDEAFGIAQREAITAYELHLRCYINGLRYAGFPAAYQTVGSSMAVRAWAYKKQGGMNCRQAGEDFYFLHRIIDLGGFTELNSTRVIPSPRPSHRVPFGTGRAVRQSLDNPDHPASTYAMQSYRDLRQLLGLARDLRLASPEATGRKLRRLSPALRSFLETQEFPDELDKMRRETQREDTYRKRFFGWFNAFRVMKYMHHGRDGFYGTGNITESAVELLRLLGRKHGISSDATPGQLLERYREMDRQGWNPEPW